MRSHRSRPHRSDRRDSKLGTKHLVRRVRLSHRRAVARIVDTYRTVVASQGLGWQIFLLQFVHFREPDKVECAEAAERVVLGPGGELVVGVISPLGEV